MLVFVSAENRRETKGSKRIEKMFADNEVQRDEMVLALLTPIAANLCSTKRGVNTSKNEWYI